MIELNVRAFEIKKMRLNRKLLCLNLLKNLKVVNQDIVSLNSTTKHLQMRTFYFVLLCLWIVSQSKHPYSAILHLVKNNLHLVKIDAICSIIR